MENSVKREQGEVGEERQGAEDQGMKRLQNTRA